MMTLSLAGLAWTEANDQVRLTGEYQSADNGGSNVERVNTLIYAVEMEIRGIYLSPDIEAARKHAAELIKTLDQIDGVVATWQTTVRQADRIYVFDKGRIAQSGKYDELAKAPGLFAEFARRQLV